VSPVKYELSFYIPEDVIFPAVETSNIKEMLMIVEQLEE
jgi:hypothetical protein